MLTPLGFELSTNILDILPNPVLVKDQNLEYVWINKAFEKLFSVKREDVIGKQDKVLFPTRQVAQCNGGDLRVLESGVVDEAVETVFELSGEARETITRKSRLQTGTDTYYLIGVMHDITDVTRANKALINTQIKLEQHATELVRLATTDELTGCSNRRALADCEKNILQNRSLSAGMLLLDIDNFKTFNDNHGHDCGDLVLQQFAGLVRQQLSDEDYFIRLGGEEFAVMLKNISRDETVSFANKLREIVESTPLMHKFNELSYTVSIGVCVKESGSVRGVDEMLKVADTMLYAAKTNGRNQVQLAA